MEAIMGSRNNPIPSGKRSDDKAIIVLLGLTGAGKSTTLNFLFDRENMIKTESYTSQTEKIMEYNTKISVNEEDYDLKIFDTPGFGDTRQQPLVRDARFVATFDGLLKTHEDIRACYPTTVLLVAKFNDDRIDGKTSHFIQMLKAVDALLANWRLIDKKPENTNLVFVLTHTMSEDNKRLRTDPKQKIQLIECLVKTFTQIPTPIQVVMAENKPELYDLPKVNDFYKLPNGQFYPSNLFKKIQTMTVKCNDVVGETIVREAFRNPKQINIELLKEYELLPENNMVVRNILRTLKSAQFNIENTQISTEIRKRWDRIDEASKKPYVNSLQITQSTFHKHGIFGEDNIPQSIEAVLKLLMDLPLNPPVCNILDGMGVVGPELPKSLSVGKFYNIFADCPISNSPFSMDILDYTDIGFRAPIGIEARRVTESLVLNSFFDSSSQYYQERLKQLNVSGTFKMENFHSEPKEGYNIIVPRTKVVRLTGVREKRVFQVNLKQPTLSPGYRAAVGNLPSRFDPAEAEIWRAFFTANGTHVVESIYAGGGIEVIATKKENAETRVETTAQNVLLIIANILKNVGSFCPMDLDSMAEDWDFKINFVGGNPNLMHPTLKNLFRPVGVDFFKSWCDSLYAHPAMLHSEIDLECVTHYIKKTNAAEAKEINSAMVYLYSPAPPPPESQSPPETIHQQRPDDRVKSNFGYPRELKNLSRKPSSDSSDSFDSDTTSWVAAQSTQRENTKAPNNKVKNETWGNWFKRKIGNRL